MDDILASSKIAVSGMKAQATRLRIVSQNMANADSLSKVAGGDPYQRKLVVFKNVLDAETGSDVVKVSKELRDTSDFNLKYEPSHPAANVDGYIKTPNVNMLVEMMDMKQAQRSYEANLNVISASKELMAKTIDILK